MNAKEHAREVAERIAEETDVECGEYRALVINIESALESTAKEAREKERGHAELLIQALDNISSVQGNEPQGHAFWAERMVSEAKQALTDYDKIRQSEGDI